MKDISKYSFQPNPDQICVKLNSMHHWRVWGP